jgi:alpha-L-fucosidase 2
MTRVIATAALAAAMGFCTLASATPGGASAAAERYQWDSVAIGGGGFVSAVIPSHSEPGIVYARTDVGGAYRWDKASARWVPLLDWLSDADTGLLGIDSLAMDPNNAAKVYLLAGISYLQNGRSAILRSSDYGKTFAITEVTSQFKTHGNGMGRNNGERLAVDPGNGDVLYVGTRWNGLFRSADAGVTWKHMPGLDVTTTPNGAGISFVLPDPSSVPANGAAATAQRIFSGVSRYGSVGPSFYRSDDAGMSFAPVPGAPTTLMPQRATFDGAGKLYITYANGAGPHPNNKQPEPMDRGQIWQYAIDSGRWKDVTPKGYTAAFSGISVDRSNPRRLAASTISTYLPQGDGKGDRIFVSTDGGESWTDVMARGFAKDQKGVSWLKGHAIHWASTIEFDPFEPKAAWVTSGNGVFRTADINATPAVWAFHVRGLEETVPLNAVSVPGGPLVSAIGDYDGFLHVDPTQYSPIHQPEMGTTFGLASAGLKAGSMVRVGKAMYITSDGGAHWSKTPALNGEQGQVAMSSDGAVILHSPRGSTTTYRSADHGATWTPVRGLTSANLRPVADAVAANVFYAYDNGTMQVSTDGGVSFAPRAKLASGGSQVIRSAPGREGEVWVPLYGGGLARSTDSGTRFTSLAGVEYCAAVGLGKAAQGASHPAVYIWGSVGGVRGVHRSVDGGVSWARINDDAHQYGGPGDGQFIVGDMNRFGVVYMSTAGRGIVYGQPSAGEALGTSLQASAGAGTDLVLRYDRPAAETAQGWEREALPIGNGRIGAMVFGQPGREHLQFNDITLWSGDSANMGAFQPFGDVYVDLPGHSDAKEAYQRALDIGKGLHTVHYRHKGVNFERQVFASNPAQTIVLRLSADKPGQYTGSVQLTDMHGARITASHGALTAIGAMPAPKASTERGTSPRMQYASKVQVLHEGGQVSIKDGRITFTNCDALTIVVGAGTSYVLDPQRKFFGGDPAPRVATQVVQAANRGWSALKVEHETDFAALMRRTAVDLGATAADRKALPTDKRIEAYTAKGEDPELEAQFFQYGRYLLVSSSRGPLPANLQGLWNNSLTPPWNSDYHTNINVQMNYWPSGPANLNDLALPFLDFVQTLSPQYKQQTEAEEGKKVSGWALRTESNPFGYMGWKWNRTGNAWYARHFWEQYAFTQDKEYLRTVAYPLMKDIAAYWQAHLKLLPDGRLVAPDGWSPEHGPEEDGVSYDQQIIWDLFNNTAEAANTLGIDKPLRDQLAATRDKLAAPRIGSWGQLLEWLDEKRDPVLDTPNDTHRHVSHLFALYPGRQISPTTTPELAAAARRTLEARGDAGTGWSMAWKIAFWARLNDGEHAHKMLRGLLATPGARAATQQSNGQGAGSEIHNAGGTYANLLDAHPPFQIDGNFGATAAICEMLLQSHTGELHLLPALPPAWRKGQVRGLRARGGFEVDLMWAGGTLESVVVTRKAGEGAARLRYGQKTIDLQLQVGQSVRLSNKLEAIP